MSNNMTLEEWARLVIIEKVDTRGFNAKYPELFSLLNEVTSSLPENSNTKRRLWHILYGLDIPKCKICNEKDSIFSRKGEYGDYCSNSCRMKDPDVIDSNNRKIKQTKTERYGDPNYNNQEKLRETFVERYGSVDNGYSLQERQRRISNLKRHGVENLFQLEETKAKIRQTNLERYGVEYGFKSDEVKEKIRQTNLERYGVDNKVKMHLNSESIQKMNDAEWLKTQHHTNKRTLADIAFELGVHPSTIGDKFDSLGIEKKEYRTSTPHRSIVSLIESVGIDDIRVNDRIEIYPKELDIYIPSKRVAIEYCGLYWHSTGRNRIGSRYHLHKLEECLKRGIRLLTIFEDEWLYRRKQTESKILRILGEDKGRRIGARKTHISSDLSFKQINLFLEENHIQGSLPVNPTYSFGLVYENELIALMTFIRRNNEFELNRFATSCIIPGGFSKLLKFAVNEIKQPIFSFADRRWSEGDVYEKNGFVLDECLPPDYSYIENGERHHKFKYRHKQLKERFANYDSSLSERENCYRNGIFRIYNCGLKKYRIA